jgi:phage FluMu protein Com
MESKEYCPRCRIFVLAIRTESRERRTCPNGTTRDVLVRSLRCATCGCFLRSEDVPLPKEQPTAHA